MNCPKCGKELLNVNGKYLCVDCGIEVPEAENSLLKDQTTNAGATDESKPPLEDETISPDASEVAEVASTLPDLPPLQQESTTPPIADEGSELSINIPELPPEPLQNDLKANDKPIDDSVPISDLVGVNSPIVPPKENLPPAPIGDIPVYPPPVEDLPKIDLPEIAESAAPKEYPVAYPNEVNQSAVNQGLGDIFPADEVANQPQQPAIETNSFTEPADLFEKKEASNFSAEQTAFNPIPAPPAVLSTQAFNQNPTDSAAIFQDPMYDNNSTTASIQPVNHIVPAAANLEDDDRKLKIILIVGIVGAILLLIAGIVAYIMLT